MENNFTKKFLSVCCGISITVLSVAALVYAVKPAGAIATSPNSFMPSPPPEGAKYQMQYVSAQSQSGSFSWQIFCYSPETGKFKAFYWDTDVSGWKENFANAPLPSLP